jgi:hypothetical protein
MMGMMGEASEHHHPNQELEAHRRAVEAFLFDLQCVFFEDGPASTTEFFIETVSPCTSCIRL